MTNWWKCQVMRATAPFSKGAVLYARNGDDCITLFDGRKEARISKLDHRSIRLLFRLDGRDSEIIQRDYQLKMAAQSGWNGIDVRR